MWVSPSVVPPTVNASMRKVGWPTPITPWSSLLQVPMLGSSDDVVADHADLRQGLRIQFGSRVAPENAGEVISSSSIDGVQVVDGELVGDDVADLAAAEQAQYRPFFIEGAHDFLGILRCRPA